MFNVNCIYAVRTGYRTRCRHPDRQRWLGIFGRLCVEPDYNCTLKVAFKRPAITTFTPPPMRK